MHDLEMAFLKKKKLHVHVFSWVPLRRCEMLRVSFLQQFSAGMQVTFILSFLAPCHTIAAAPGWTELDKALVVQLTFSSLCF